MLLLLALLCIAFYVPYRKGKIEIQEHLAVLSQLEPGEYTVTIGVYGSGTPNFDIHDSDTQKQILQELSLTSYAGVDWAPLPMTGKDHVYWLTFFSGEPFVNQTWQIGGEDSRNCLLGRKHRLHITNANGLYALLQQIESRQMKKLEIK